MAGKAFSLALLIGSENVGNQLGLSWCGVRTDMYAGKTPMHIKNNPLRISSFQRLEVEQKGDMKDQRQHGGWGVMATFGEGELHHSVWKRARLFRNYRGLWKTLCVASAVL